MLVALSIASTLPFIGVTGQAVAAEPTKPSRAMSTMVSKALPAEMCEAMRAVDPDNTCLEKTTTTLQPPKAKSEGATYVGCRNFRQVRQNANGPRFWSFTNQGQFCYDTVRRTVWTVWQSCAETQGFGFDVTVTECRAYPYNNGTTRRQHMNRARVSLGFNGVPFHYTFSQWTNAQYNGGFVYWHTTT